MPGLASNLRAFFPPAAPFTEKNLDSQAGKVFLITGSSGGIGKELAQILYSKDARVYVAARSKDKANTAIEAIKVAAPKSKGSLVFLHLDLDDLTTIRKSADEFLSKESRLDVLWNNAGVMVPPQGSKTMQGYELQLGTNCVAPFLFTKYLTPILQQTAKIVPSGGVRVVWVSSSATELLAPKNGIDLNNLDYKVDQSAPHKYGVSKAGNFYHATEYAKRYKTDGIISMPLNPGNLKSDLLRSTPTAQRFMISWLLHDPIQGAYTLLFAGLSTEVTPEKTGRWIQPWGRFVDIREDVAAGAKSEAEGGTGTAEKFWLWSEEQVKLYL